MFMNIPEIWRQKNGVVRQIFNLVFSGLFVILFVIFVFAINGSPVEETIDVLETT